MILVAHNQAPTKTLAERLKEARALSPLGIRLALGLPEKPKPKKN